MARGGRAAAVDGKATQLHGDERRLHAARAKAPQQHGHQACTRAGLEGGDERGRQPAVAFPSDRLFFSGSTQ